MEARRFSRAMKAIRTAAAELKQEAETFYPRMVGSLSSWLMGLPRSNYNYAAEIGDGLMSSSVMPVIQWFMRVFPEARLVLQAQQGDEWEPTPAHPLLDLLTRPNPWYDGNILWMTTVYDYCWFGQSYWRILRTRGGFPGELVWMPNWAVLPNVPANGGAFIESYTYQPVRGTAITLSPEEVIHFRHGLDPRNPAMGLPPLRSILREIWSDEEASNFVASLLRNSAVTSTLISPDAQGGEGAIISPEQGDEIKAYVTQRFTGDARGVPMILNGPLKVQRLGFAPNELDLSSVRNTTEERVCAALGARAAVIGFGTGLEQTTVGATMIEEVRMSWVNGLIPMQRLMATTLAQKLLPLFEDQSARFRLDWDYSKVHALQEDQQAKAVRINTMVQGGWFKVSEAREAMGLESEPSDEVYLRSFSLTEVPAGIPQEELTPRAPLSLVPRRDEADEEDEVDEVDEETRQAKTHRLKGHRRIQRKADADAIIRLANRLEPQMRARFLVAVDRLKAGIDQELLEDALRAFDAELAATAIPWEIFQESFGREATAMLREAVGQAGQRAAMAMQAGLQIDVRFDLNNPVAIQWAEQHAGRLVRDITGRTEVAIRELVAQSLRGEWTWQQVAKQVHRMVGLTERQALAVLAFELRLRRDEVPVEAIGPRVERYAAAQLRLRADTIARTEILTSANMGQQLAWEGAVRDGWLDRNETFKTWIIADDERLCPICENLDGDEVPLYGVFAGGFQQPPAH